MLTMNGRLNGNTSTYTCNSGFELDGSEVRTCQSDGMWTGSEPQCILIAITVTGTQNAGEDFTLTCAVSGGGTTTTAYQWLRNNSPLTGETSDTLSFTPLRQTPPTSNGQYICQAIRSGRTFPSNSFTITVETPPVTLVIAANGSPTEGQSYSLTCDLMGDESLAVTDMRFRWDRLTPISQNSILRAAILTFNSLSVEDEGQYMCTTTITSTYLISAQTRIQTATVSLNTTALLPGSVINLVANTPTTATTITINWQLATTEFVERFEVLYSYTVNTCTAPPGPTSMDTISDSTVRTHTLSGLIEDSQYTITVRAINSEGSTMNITTANTVTASPGVSPGNVRSTGSTATSITLTWDRLSCVDRNGEITGYRIQYGITSFDTAVMITGTSSDRTFTASGLVPLTTYMFRVAAVNSDGVGPNSDAETFNTSLPHVSGSDTGVIIGGVVAVISVIAVAAVTVVVVLAIVLRGKQRQQTPPPNTEIVEGPIYNTTDEGPEYEEIQESMLQASEEFALRECPAYMPTTQSSGVGGGGGR